MKGKPKMPKGMPPKGMGKGMHQMPDGVPMKDSEMYGKPKKKGSKKK